jgi:hypothetical protein
MSDNSHIATFVELVLRGEAVPADINDFIERWHAGEDPRSISEYLGFSPSEYARWVEEPACLGSLLNARRRHKR